MPIGGLNTNSHLPALNYVHRIACLAGAKQECVGFAVEALQQLAQLFCGFVVERFK